MNVLTSRGKKRKKILGFDSRQIPWIQTNPVRSHPKTYMYLNSDTHNIVGTSYQTPNTEISYAGITKQFPYLKFIITRFYCIRVCFYDVLLYALLLSSDANDCTKIDLCVYVC